MVAAKKTQVRSWVLGTALLAFLLLVVTTSAPYFKHVKQVLFEPDSSDRTTVHALKHNIWSDLSADEAEEVISFLLAQRSLNLTKSAEASSDDNRVLLVEVLQPNKSEVLSYLGGTSGPPPRWARAAIEQGTTQEAHIANYMVGPLPVSKSTSVLPLDYIFSSGRNYALNPLADQLKLQAWVDSYILNNTDIIDELLSDSAHPIRPNLAMTGRISYLDHGSLIIWVQLIRSSHESDAKSLLPQGLYIQLNASTRDSSNWKILQWCYNNQLYESEAKLRVAMMSPDFGKNGLNIDGNWTDIEDFDSAPSGREQAPPMMIQPSGARYRLDEKQKFVSWMGFEFYMATSSATGLALYDIRFNGDSVIYELGMQEAMAHYAGDDPVQGGQEFLDSSMFMGLSMYELVPGYDCPAYATYLSTSYSTGESEQIYKNSICVFEYTADHPLQRHTADERVSISRNTYLVVRFVSTVWNYDYTFDYIFYLDGTVEVKVRASGFIFGAFWTGTQANENEYGYRVHDAVSTSMHDHVINFKADLDIAGTNNTMVRVAVEPMTTEYPWDDENTTPRNTMHLVNRPIEFEAGLDWPRNSGELLIVMNQNATNAWGERRGYRIQPGTGASAPIHLTILNSTALGKAAEWASQDLWVLKRKDTEPKSSSPLNALSPLDPLVDFSKFVDDEKIVQDDLVVWFNLGTHHVPHSGDIPNTLMHTSSSSVMFTPFNFHDRDPSRHTCQGVKIEKGKRPRYFGGTYSQDVKLKITDLEPDLTGYRVPEEAGTNDGHVEKLGGPAPWH